MLIYCQIFCLYSLSGCFPGLNFYQGISHWQSHSLQTLTSIVTSYVVHTVAFSSNGVTLQLWTVSLFYALDKGSVLAELFLSIACESYIIKLFVQLMFIYFVFTWIIIYILNFSFPQLSYFRKNSII